MRQIIKGFVAALLGVATIVSLGASADAKTYYDKRFNDYNVKIWAPYKGELPKQTKTRVAVSDEIPTDTRNDDFNLDGKFDKVTFSVSNQKKNSSELKVKLNGKYVIKKKAGYVISAQFYSFKLNGVKFSVLIYGDEDYAGGAAYIYKWKGSTPKLIKQHKAKGYLSVFVAKDKTLKKNVLYICDQVQLFNHYGNKWPKDILNIYSKYKDNESDSVTMRTYEKYVVVKGKLKKKATDTYYFVSNAYD